VKHRCEELQPRSAEPMIQGCYESVDTWVGPNQKTSTNMRHFGTEINGNRVENAELFHETRSAMFIRLTNEISPSKVAGVHVIECLLTHHI
jgi:hypothetical protein